MANTATNVTTGKPNIAGAIFRAPLGTTVPTNASEALDDAFVCLGYVSDAGIENDNPINVTQHKAWGGATVLSELAETSDDFNLALIEAENPDVLKTAYGDANVTVTGDKIAVHVKPESPVESAYVIDMAYRGNKKHRKVIACGAITAREAISYNGVDPVAYGITISARLDETGATHHEYTE